VFFVDFGAPSVRQRRSEDDPMKPPGAKFDDDQIIEALQATRCNLAEATRFLVRKWNVPCSRHHVAVVVKRRRRLTEWVREYREIVADRAEANIFRAVENGDYQASVLVVRTLGKDRGWVPRSEKDTKLPAASLVEAIARGRDRPSGIRSRTDRKRARSGASLDATSTGQPRGTWNSSIQEKEKENDVRRS
jgi:hypothetical protein